MIKQAKIFQTYLPEQLNDQELETRIKTIIQNVNAQSIKDIGKVMGVASRELAGIAQGKRINETLKKLLT